MEHTHELRALIGRVRRRWFALVLLRTVGLAAAAAAVPALVTLGFHAAVPFEGTTLVVTAILATFLSVACAIAVVGRMQRRPDDRRVARFIEERASDEAGGGALEDEIVSAVEVAGGEHAPAFAHLVVERALGHLRDVSPGALIPSSALRRASLQALGGSTLLVLALVFAGAPLLAAWDTALVRWYPGALRIDVNPGDVRVPAGAPLRITASITGRVRSAPALAPSLVVSAGGQERAVPMTAGAGGFDFSFESVDRTFRYKVTAGAVSSSEYTVTALFPPRVKRIDLSYRYPAFTGLGVRNEEDGGDIYGPAGTRVRLQIHTDKPVAAGELAIPGASPSTLARVADTVLETDLVLAKDGSYRVRLTDRDGLRSVGDTEYFIRLMDDRPPDVRLVRPASDQQITPLEEVSIEARADDDYGISSFELVYAVAGKREKVVPFSRVTGTNVARIGSLLLPAEDLQVQPGDVITYYARARDVPRGKRPTETRSDIFFLEVRPFNEEFVAAQSQAVAGGGDAQIESLISAQKEIINATWNLERRSGAGRSADDVRAVAQAQAELRLRVEQLIGGGRGRGGIPPPFQVVRPGQGRTGGDPVAAAVDAMSRALEQLEAQKTGAALPHEMAALQGLIKAQAEIQRRQVTQQQANGGGGASGRQGQDLSALFDKELQRQQRTNYETRSPREETPDASQNQSALERIRELARRQEELSRRQRELARAGVSEEEMKRQLEKLTREQNELREQTEALGRQLADNEAAGRGRPNEPSRQDGRGSSAESGGSTAREASEDMRNAAGELQRQDPNAAAARAEQAAERLRQLEQQMSGTSAGAQQRAAGDLRLEAQQIAEAQRRIASEAERADKAGRSAGADARRRLASEKERLADRVEALQRAGQRLGAESKEKSAAAADAAEGARELERQKVAERMRETAKTMRDGGRSGGRTGEKNDGREPGAAGGANQPSGAEAEQQIARALEQAAGKFGGASDAEARQLSEGLDRGREIRERLDRLERQVRDAEQQAAAGRPDDTGQTSNGTPNAGRQGKGREGDRGQGDGRQNAGGRQGPGGDRARGSRDGGGAGDAGSDLRRLREEYSRELRSAREELRRMQGGVPRDGSAGTTPEQHEWSRSAPGNESFKQDFGGWESLRKDVDLALEQYEAAVSGRLAKKLAEDRLSAGGSDRAPDDYRRLIAKYYELLARTKK